MTRLLTLSACALVLSAAAAVALGQSGYRPVEPPPTSVLITVRLPAEASLTIDGARTTQTGQERQFVSPPLPTDKVFVYTLKATWTADGKKVEREKKVEVSAGARVSVDMNKEE
jgi:uncharacterized protein (TIGR03000 family)